MDFQAIREQARNWRENQETGCERSIGYVVIFNGQVAGWKRELDNPQGWEPGCLAVGPIGSVYQAEGGNAYDGARVWQRLDLPNPMLRGNASINGRSCQLMHDVTHLSRKIRAAFGRTAHTAQADTNTPWKMHFEQFCQMTGASGAQWACNGYGKWHLIEANDVPLEAAIAELLEHFGLPFWVFGHELGHQLIAGFSLEGLAALYRLGFLLPVEDLQRACDTEYSRGHSRNFDSRQKQCRKTKSANCEQPCQRASGQNCLFQRTSDDCTSFYFHGNPCCVVNGLATQA